MLPVAALFVLTAPLAAPATTPLALAALPAAASPQVDVASMFPPPKEGLVITVAPDRPSPDATTFPRLLDDFTRVTGVTLQASKETLAVLEQTPLGLNQSITVPASEVYRIVETLLVANDFCFVRLSNREPRIWMVVSLLAGGSRGGPSLRNDALQVDMRELALLVDHPGTLVTTAITLPRTDVRTLANALRPMITDANTQQLLPAGANSVILTGFAPQVAGLARLLHTIDELSTAAPEAQGDAVPARPAPARK